jgi:DNA-binding transcriptional LysR family regulator
LPASDSGDRAGVTRVQLRHLETFLAIVEGGTLTAAARQLFKTQGAISHDLKALERVVGVKLIDRSRQRVELTPGGIALLPHAQEMIARTRAIELTMERLARGERAVVRLGAVPSLALVLVPLIAAFRRARPEVIVKISTGDTRTLHDQLAAGGIDLVVAEASPRDGVASRKLADEDFLVVLQVDDPLASSPRLNARELVDRDLVGFDRELERPELAERFFASVDRYPDAAVETTQFWLMERLVEAGAGYALLPVSVLRESTTLVGVPTDPRLTREIVLSYSTRRVIPNVVVEFQEYLQRRWGPAFEGDGHQPIS